MSPCRIKICGLKRYEDIFYVNRQMPDYAGFVFAPGKRQVKPDFAELLAKELDARIEKAGVFVNEEADRVIEVVKRCGLNIIQLHGYENQDYINVLKKELEIRIPEKSIRIWKAIGIKDADSTKKINDYEVDAFVLDAFSEGTYGGSGKTFNWDLVANLRRYPNIVLAGGLNAENVKKAVSKMRPYAVDVSSGVETHGSKDEEKIKKFIHSVRG